MVVVLVYGMTTSDGVLNLTMVEAAAAARAGEGYGSLSPGAPTTPTELFPMGKKRDQELLERNARLDQLM